MSDSVSSASGNPGEAFFQVSSNSAGSSAKVSKEDAAWLDKAKSTMLSFSTSDSDVLEFMMKTFNDPNVSEAKKQAIQYLLSLRTELSTLISNIMRQLFDGANAIIRNIRD